MHNPKDQSLGFAYKKDKSQAEQDNLKKAAKEQYHVHTVEYDFTFYTSVEYVKRLQNSFACWE